jgi:hypothetical protein
MSAICRMIPPSSHWAMTLYVRSAAISAQTWRRIGPSTPRRVPPNYARTRSACTTEGNHAFCLGSFCRINRVIISCAYHNDQSHMYSGLPGPRAPLWSMPRPALIQCGQTSRAPPTKCFRRCGPRARRQCRSEQHRNRRSDFGPSLGGMKSAQAVLNPRELTRFGFVLPNSWIRLRRQLHTIIGRDYNPGSAGRL